MVTNSEIALFLQFKKHCDKISCDSWRGRREWPYYDGLDFKNNTELQLEALKILGEGTIIRGVLTISINADKVVIAQGHYCAIKPTFEESAWSFLSWITHHEYKKGKD